MFTYYILSALISPTIQWMFWISLPCYFSLRASFCPFYTLSMRNFLWFFKSLIWFSAISNHSVNFILKFELVVFISEQSSSISCRSFFMDIMFVWSLSGTMNQELISNVSLVSCHNCFIERHLLMTQNKPSFCSSESEFVLSYPWAGKERMREGRERSVAFLKR